MQDFKQFKVVTQLPNGDKISTVSLPKHFMSGFSYPFETCIFKQDGSSNVIAIYDTKEEAIKNHVFLVGHELMHDLIGETFKESENG
jgi:hypothetical protein